jgi:putative ABC transport system permease protein
MALSYGTAARIAVRELRSSRGKFAFVVLSVAIGVAALTGVRGFSSAFRAELLLRARSILAADIAAKTTTPLTPEQQAGLEKLRSAGDDETQVTELLSMASAAGSLDPMLVSVKAVEPGKWPFYGTVVLVPKMPLEQALTGNSVAVGDDLLLRLHLRVGDSIKLGGEVFRIAAAVEDEPDRLSGAFAAGPRVLISQAALEGTGLVAPGSHASRRYLFRLPVVAVGTSLADRDVASLKTQLETLLPEAQVSDYREANASLTKALDGATGLLSLMSLVALVLGAVGVAMAMRAHLQQRLDSIAIMKSLGAGTAQVMKIYVIQTVMLGLGGGVLGVVMGLGVQAAFPLFLAKLLHLTPAVRLDAHAVGLGLTAGLLTTLLFTLPPLLDIRGVRPILILRRNVEEPARSVGEWVRTKLRSLPVQLTTSVIILGGLLWLAYRVSDSLKVGGIFAAGLGGALLVLLVMAWLTLLLLKLFLRGTRLHLPSVLRHGLANLYRPGNPSAALLAALGLGVMQIAAVYMVQRSIVNEMQVAVADKVPNLFLIDMTSDEVGGIKRLLGQQPSVQGTPEIVPVVGARLTLVNGAKPERLQEQREGRGDRDGRSAYGVSLTWAPDAEVPPPGDKVENGAWWTAAQAAASVKTPLVAVERGRAERLKAKVGDTITFAIQDQTITATVAATYEADSQHSFSRAEFVMPEPMLEGMPVVWYGGVHCKPGATGELRRALYETFPTVTVIDVAATLEVIRQVLLQITYVIQFLAAFSIFAGIVILASAIAGTKYRRVREVVVLKTLGATRTRIAAIFSVEFAVLGLIAGAVGLVFANLLARGILHSLHFEYGFQPLFTLAAWLTTSVLTVAAGWIASYRVLGQKPLEVLREE